MNTKAYNWTDRLTIAEAAKVFDVPRSWLISQIVSGYVATGEVDGQATIRHLSGERLAAQYRDDLQRQNKK